MNEEFSSPFEILHWEKGFDIRKIPERLQSFSASLNHPDYGAHVHFFEDESRCPVYRNGLTPHLHHIRKFRGAVTLDRSLGWCDDLDVQRDADKLNRHSRPLFSENGIPYIVNIRFGDAKSYSFCFDEIPGGSALFVGTHGAMKRADFQIVQTAGVVELLHRLNPEVLLLYGHANERILQECRERGTTLVRYPSQCETAHSKIV